MHVKVVHLVDVHRNEYLIGIERASRRRASHRRVSHRSAPHRRACHRRACHRRVFHGHVSHGRVSFADRHLKDLHLIGMHLIDLHLTGAYIPQDVHLRCVYLMDVVSRGHASYRRACRRQYLVDACLKAVHVR